MESLQSHFKIKIAQLRESGHYSPSRARRNDTCVRRRAASSAQNVPQPPESARRDEHKFDLRGNGGWEPLGGDTSTWKNIFLGNKLPENLIFPLVELCLHQGCFLQIGKNPTRREDGQPQQSQTCPSPKLGRTCRAPTHPLNSRLNLLLNINKPT